MVIIAVINSSSRNVIRKRRFFLLFVRHFIAVIMIMLGLTFLVDIRLRPVIEKNAEYQSRVLAIRIINSSIYDEISRENYQYSNLIDLCYDDNGHISSIETNIVNVNKLKSLVTQNINEKINNIKDYTLYISLGTISGIKMLYGLGPELPFYIKPSGYIGTTLISSFEEAGINQTLHKIVMRVETVISAVIPGYTSEISIKTDFVIAETVIVGDVPDNYTHVITGNEDVISSINDYRS